MNFYITTTFNINDYYFIFITINVSQQNNSIL